MNDIEIKNVSKEYLVSHEQPMLISELFLGPFRRRASVHKVWALKDISFEVKRGETLGVIGENGSGKSTLLKILTGVTSPTYGSVKINGRVGALLELAAGLHPDLTGRENVYLNGSILGLSRKEIDSKFEDILNFADLNSFIDSPVRIYSSGMLVRLGFSVAVHMDPDILLIDEALAVGDEEFQRRCMEKFSEFKSKNTIILVSHNLPMIGNLCNRVLWLKGGILQASGPPDRIINAYLADVEREKEVRFNEARTKTWVIGNIEVDAVHLFDTEGKEKYIFKTFDDLIIKIDYRMKSFFEKPCFGVAIYKNDGSWIHGTNTLDRHVDLEIKAESGTITVIYPKLPLLKGQYLISVRASSQDKWDTYAVSYKQCRFEIISEEADRGAIYLPHHWEKKIE